MSDEPQKPSDVQYSFDLRSKAISRSDPHSKSVKRIRSSDRLLLTAQNSIEEDADENTMATAAPERQVHVSTGGETHTAQEGPQADLTEMLHDQIQRLQSELRFAQAENREMADKNRQLAANKRITDSIIAPKPFLGNTNEQEAGDWLNWFIKFADFKKLNDEERRDLFLVMLQ
jgi:cysteine sulfinate desulfinase/cysteine desulfurase-like protein